MEQELREVVEENIRLGNVVKCYQTNLELLSKKHLIKF